MVEIIFLRLSTIPYRTFEHNRVLIVCKFQISFVINVEYIHVLPLQNFISLTAGIVFMYVCLHFSLNLNQNLRTHELLFLQSSLFIIVRQTRIEFQIPYENEKVIFPEMF